MLLKPEDEIAINHGQWVSTYKFLIDHSQDIDSVNGASSRFYELATISSPYSIVNPACGFQIQYVLDNGVVKNRFIIQSSGNTAPGYASVNSTTALTNTNEFWIEEGDVIRGFSALNDPGNSVPGQSSTKKYEFTVFPEMLYRSDGNDYESTIEFDVASNSMKYVIGGNFPTAINSGSTEGITIRRESFGGLVSMYWRSHVQGTQTIGYVSSDGYTGTWTVHHPTSNANIISWVIVGTAAEEAAANPPENDPPPTPVFVPRSARRGNLNFW